MAIMAKYFGQYDDFKTNISSRHTSNTVSVVDASVRFLPNDPGTPVAGTSHLLGTGDAGKSKTSGTSRKSARLD
jgi:hypothetical protein